MFILFYNSIGCVNKNTLNSNDSSASQISNTKNDNFDLLGGSGNGKSYDGKLEIYQSRETVNCNDSIYPKTIIVKTLDLNPTIQVTKKTLTNGQCTNESFQVFENKEVITYPSSQLATFNFGLHDKVINTGEVLLDNKTTKIVCKLNSSPLVLLDNLLTGVVVYSKNSLDTTIWNSRLDFTQTTSKTNYLFQNPLYGKLYQNNDNLEFVTESELTELNPFEYQLMHIKIGRSYSDLLSPSMNYGKNTFQGTFQYAYFNFMDSESYSISSNEIPVTCFIDDIKKESLIFQSESSFDFLKTLIGAVSSR